MKDFFISPQSLDDIGTHLLFLHDVRPRWEDVVDNYYHVGKANGKIEKFTVDKKRGKKNKRITIGKSKVNDYGKDQLATDVATQLGAPWTELSLKDMKKYMGTVELFVKKTYF